MDEENKSLIIKQFEGLNVPIMEHMKSHYLKQKILEIC